MAPFLFKKTSRGKKYWYIGENERKEGKVVRAWETYIGTTERILELVQQKDVEVKYITPYKFGVEAAALSIIKKLRLQQFVNDLGLKTRDQGIDLGSYVVLMVINRLASPKSKSKIASWYKSTFLKHYLQLDLKLLNGKRFWDHMNYFDQTKIVELEHHVINHMIKEFQLNLDTLLYDPTNFSTYINKNRPHDVARLGNSKSKRFDLLQVNLAILATRKDGVPLLHHTYPGNINDPTEFKTILPIIMKKYDDFDLQALTDLTIVFDKGNNSQTAIRELVNSKYHFVGSLRPSTQKELLMRPLELYNNSFKDEDDEEIQAYRCKKKIYGEEFTLVMTYNKSSANAAKTALEEKIELTEQELEELDAKIGQPYYRDQAKLEDKLKRIINKKDIKGVFSAEIQNLNGGQMHLIWEINHKEAVNRSEATRKQLSKAEDKLQELAAKIGGPYYRSKKKIEKKISAIINQKRISDLITAQLITPDVDKMKLRWHKNKAVIDVKMRQMGKRILFTDQHDWSTEEILDAYTSMWRIERDFHELKSPDFIRVTPMYHWTENKIRLHLFVCFLALIVQRLLHRELRLNNIEMSIGEAFEELSLIHEVSYVIGNDDEISQFKVSKLNKKQKLLMETFGLYDYLKS